MRTKNHIKAKSDSRGQGKLGYTESSKLVSTLKRKVAARLSEDEANEVGMKNKKRKQKPGTEWYFLRKSDRTAQLIKSVEHNGHTLQVGDKITWDGNYGFNTNGEGHYTSREGWQYNIIKFIAKTAKGVVIATQKRTHFGYGYNQGNIQSIASYKNVRPYNYNPRTAKGTYKEIEQDFCEAIEFFSEFPGKESDDVLFNGRTKKEYKAYGRNVSKALGI